MLNVSLAIIVILTYRQDALEREQRGATTIPIIISSDKTQLTLFRGKTVYPYTSQLEICRNISEQSHHNMPRFYLGTFRPQSYLKLRIEIPVDVPLLAYFIVRWSLYWNLSKRLVAPVSIWIVAMEWSDDAIHSLLLLSETILNRS